MPSDVRVIVMNPKNGQERAQIKTGSAAQPGANLNDFAEPVRALLAARPPGTYVVCEPMANPTPSTVKPASTEAVVHVAGAGSASSASGEPVYLPSDFDRANPYNFAEWDDPPFPIEQPQAAAHDAWSEERYSGCITLKLTAKTPIFIPAGDDIERSEPRRPQPFWVCRDAAGHDRLGLPGSSVKGAVRTLFETWTNSRATIVSDEQYARPIPYRRRTATGWVIEGPHPNGGLKVRSCEILFADYEQAMGGLNWFCLRGRNRVPWNAAPQAWRQAAPQLQTEVDLSDDGWQALEFRANLFWVAKPEHRHERWACLAVRLHNGSARIKQPLIEAYLRSLEHESFEKHWRRVAVLEPAPGGGARSYYTGMDNDIAATLNPRELEEACAQEYRRALPGLKALGPGTLLFGLAESGEVICFGKNVNFLWPSKRPPKELIGRFWPSVTKAEDLLKLSGADAPEAAFGFAAAHREERDADGNAKVISHPFRSRVRFETFWADTAATTFQLPLRKLLSPTGVKLKARPLYLRGRTDDGRSATYDEETALLRGRKFYWHQGTTREQVPAHHQTEPDLLLEALPARTIFTGGIHFDQPHGRRAGCSSRFGVPRSLLGDSRCLRLEDRQGQAARLGQCASGDRRARSPQRAPRSVCRV
jgi:CRISPR-associated protein (TIGR03986 family)